MNAAGIVLGMVTSSFPFSISEHRATASQIENLCIRKLSVLGQGGPSRVLSPTLELLLTSP